MTSAWNWWAGSNGEFFEIGPCASREEAISCAVTKGLWEIVHICEAYTPPIQLADWIDVDGLLERADESVWDTLHRAEFDDGPVFDVTPEQATDLVQRVKQACHDWQTAHGLTFKVNTFQGSRNHEFITMEDHQ